MIFSYRFVMSSKDVQDANEAYMSSKSGMRRIYRLVMALFGAMWLAGGVASYLQSGANWKLVFGLTLGIPTLYWFGVHPFLRRITLRRLNGGSVSWEFDAAPEGVGMRKGNSDWVRRQWSDLRAVHINRKGVLCWFSSNDLAWIPNRVFRDKEEKKEFSRFLASQNKRVEEPS